MHIRGSFRQTFTTGAVTGIAAAAAAAGHLLALRNPDKEIQVVLRALEVEFILTTAFAAPQDVGFDVVVARDYTADHAAGTALTLGASGRRRKAMKNSVLTGRVAAAAELTAGVHTFDADAIARGSAWMGAVGAQLEPRRIDLSDAGFDQHPMLAGIWLAQNEGVVVRNSILMGGGGVGKWHFTAEYLEVVI